MKIFTAAIFAVVFALFTSFSAYAQKQAEVVVTSTHLRKAPDINSEKVQTLEKGEKVVYEKSRDTNGWFYVSVSDGSVKGWIRKDTIRTTENAEPVKPQPQKTNPKDAQKDAQKENQKQNQKNAQTAQKINQSEQKAVQTPREVKQTPQKINQNQQNPIPTPAPIASRDSTVNSISTPSASPSPTPTAEPAVIEDNEVLRIDTEEVNLNVRVVDAANRPVGNLNQAHFKVYEDDVLQPITSLTTAEVPAINALVIDNSRSLRTQLKKIIEAGKIIVGTNRPKDESAVVRFVSSDKIEVVQDFTDNKDALGGALDNLFVEGGQTAIIDAVYLAARKIERYQNSGKNDDVKLRALILVSDGDDRGSSQTEQQLFKLLRDSNVQIYAIGFVSDLSRQADSGAISRQEKAKDFLNRLARETGGKVYFPDSIDELPRIASEISGELRTQYLISYAPTNDARDGSFRKIKVEIADGTKGEKRIAVTRAGRNAAPK